MSLKNLLPQSLKNIWHFFQAVWANLYFGFPSRNLTVIGVTGTDGKTTTSTLIYHLLDSLGVKVALISTVAAYVGPRQLDTGFHVTSPDPFKLQSLLSRIQKSGFTHVVLETTSHGLNQHRLFGINFTLGVLTNITREHLDYHGTIDRYIRAKSKLFRASRHALLNSQDQHYSKLRRLLPPGLSLTLYPDTSLDPKLLQAIDAKFKEPYNRSNAQAAIKAVNLIHNQPVDLSQALASFPGIPGRMEDIPNPHRFRVIVDFAHTPNALKNALTSLKASSKGKLIAVFGCAGLRDTQKRPAMGKIASELADEVILTAEDPRTESIHLINNQIISGISTNHGHIHQIPDRQQAIDFAISLAKPGDTVGIFGKGHERSLCFGKIEHPWSDQKAARKALAQYVPH